MTVWSFCNLIILLDGVRELGALSLFAFPLKYKTSSLAIASSSILQYTFYTQQTIRKYYFSELIMLNPFLLEAYHQTHYCFGDALLNVDELSSKAAALLQPFTPDGGLFITAWNPLGKELKLEDNKKANQTLKEELLKKGLNVIDGYGASNDGKWREDSFFTYPIDTESSLKLCSAFHQNAVIYVSSYGLPELLLHPEVS